MKARFAAVVALALLIGIFVPLGTTGEDEQDTTAQRAELNRQVRGLLESKKSPLAPETDLLLEQKHWKLLIAISAIESQYCTRQLGNNCWGIGGDSAYRHYSSIPEAIADADALIERWQKKGRWLTVDDMNCHYVVPCNPNWVSVVNRNLEILTTYERRAGTIPQ